MKPLKAVKKIAAPVSAADVAAMFKARFKRGPWPSERECYRLAIDITVVRRAPAQPVKHADKTFADRLRIFNEMKKLARKQIKSAKERSCGLRLPGLISLEVVVDALDHARDGLLFPYDPLAGARAGSEWHKPARYLARKVEEAMKAAGHEVVSHEKNGRFISAVCGSLELAGQGQHEPAAVAAVLAASPL
jgi:hypothetical protein